MLFKAIEEGVYSAKIEATDQRLDDPLLGDVVESCYYLLNRRGGTFLTHVVVESFALLLASFESLHKISDIQIVGEEVDPKIIDLLKSLFQLGRVGISKVDASAVAAVQSGEDGLYIGTKTCYLKHKFASKGYIRCLSFKVGKLGSDSEDGGPTETKSWNVHAKASDVVKNVKVTLTNKTSGDSEFWILPGCLLDMVENGCLPITLKAVLEFMNLGNLAYALFKGHWSMVDQIGSYKNDVPLELKDILKFAVYLHDVGRFEAKQLKWEDVGENLLMKAIPNGRHNIKPEDQLQVLLCGDSPQTDLVERSMAQGMEHLNTFVRYVMTSDVARAYCAYLDSFGSALGTRPAWHMREYLIHFAYAIVSGDRGHLMALANRTRIKSSKLFFEGVFKPSNKLNRAFPASRSNVMVNVIKPEGLAKPVDDTSRIVLTKLGLSAKNYDVLGPYFLPKEGTESRRKMSEEIDRAVKTGSYSKPVLVELGKAFCFARKLTDPVMIDLSVFKAYNRPQK